jgi:cobalt/nickel transport system ATP-binding protein
VLFELEEVSLSRGGALVLDRLSAVIPPGATAVVGPSGSGKSSLLRLLNRLADPDRGRILYRGTPLPELDVLGLRREVMLVPQLPALVPGTVADNIAFAARLARRERYDAGRALRAAGLAPSFADRDAAQLSVGEQHRAMLARALATEPRVLLLDEPTANLDPRSTGWLVDFLQDLSVTSVATTHNLSLAGELGDRVLVLSEAHQLIFDGHMEDLLGDREKLLAANLVHSHRRRGSRERRLHLHDWS